MTAAGVTLAGQRAAETLMVDACSITRVGAGAPVFDPDTGQYVDPDPTAVYAGKCRVKPSSLSGTGTVEAGERQVAVWPYVVSIPITATGVQLNDVVTVTASGDPALVGHQLRVRSIAHGTYLTARRLDCEEADT